MNKNLLLILLTSILAACGGSGGSSSNTEKENTSQNTEKDDTESNSENDTSKKTILNFDASKLAYFSIKHGEGEWKKLENKKQDIEISDPKGDISLVIVCDETERNEFVDREFEVAHLRIKESQKIGHWCRGLDKNSPNSITLASAQPNISITAISTQDLISTVNSDTFSATFSDLSGSKTIVASASDFNTKKVYLYRKTYEQLTAGNTYTLDFLSSDAIELSTLPVKEKENGFSYGYNYLPAVNKVWDLFLSTGTDNIGVVPNSFIQSGDLFIHFYSFGTDSEIRIINNKQESINPLTSVPKEYKPSDFNISEDKKSVSFSPKKPPLESLNSDIHRLLLDSDQIEYTINAERFSEKENTLTLVDFSALPNFSGDLPKDTITRNLEVTSYFKSSKIGQPGSQSLFISTGN